ncbi:MAG: magnesium transporter CorA family protein [Spirochaetales bacterium]|nr:magnesium transporter CorA family protein [Spirochaetales bacterium]
MLKTYRFENNRICESQEADCPILVFTGPDEAERHSLTGTYLVDEHTLASALDPDEISRLEYEPDHIAIILKRPRNYSSQDDLRFKVASIGVFIFADKLVIVMSDEIPILEFDQKRLVKVGNLKDVFLKIVFGTISHFLAHLRIINQISESLEQKINTSMENKYLLNMFTLQKSLVYYLNGISYNASLFEKLKNSVVKVGFNQDQVETLDDIIIENGQCLKQAEIYTNILSGLMDARASIVNNNLNLSIKRLTIINIVFLPITFIASVGGMSEYTLMTRSIPIWLSYLLFSVAMAGIAFGTYFVLRKINYERTKRERLPKPKRKPPSP